MHTGKESYTFSYLEKNDGGMQKGSALLTHLSLLLLKSEPHHHPPHPATVDMSKASLYHWSANNFLGHFQLNAFQILHMFSFCFVLRL